MWKNSRDGGGVLPKALSSKPVHVQANTAMISAKLRGSWY